MKRLYLDIRCHSYNKENVYGLAYKLGRRLSDYLGQDMFSLLLDSQVLIKHNTSSELILMNDHSYMLHPASKALEGFLLKIIKGKKLKMNEKDSIGGVFGMKSSIVHNKIKNKKLIAKTKSVYDFCRNDVMHYEGKRISTTEVHKKYDEMLETIILLFNDFYGKSEPDDDIKKGYAKYVASSWKK